MILIADSGSTKTDWAFVENGEIIEQKVTPGINPVHMSETEIREILTLDSSLFTPFPSDARLPVAFQRETVAKIVNVFETTKEFVGNCMKYLLECMEGLMSKCTQWHV